MGTLRFRQSLNSIPVYIPAKSLEETKKDLGLKQVIRLAANENTMGFSPLVEQAIRQTSANLFLYPDSFSSKLRSKLTETGHFRPEQLVFGNGSFELLSLVAQAYLNEGDEALIPVPSFGWYNVATLAAGGVPVHVDLNNHRIDLGDLKRKITNNTRIIWLCNPNNPTGTFFNAQELEAFLKDVPDTIAIVIDEAYFEYVESTDYPNTVKLLDSYPNIIVLRTFSKAYGLAGLRIGYGIAAP
jgi:histidinol-phosphate aminotransferase